MGKKNKGENWAKKIADVLRISPDRINKFSVVGVCFLFWLTFFDSHNLIDRYKVGRNLRFMENEKKEYIRLIAEAKQNKIDLDKNKEKFAREKYYMHKAGEEVFIIENKRK